MQDGRRGSGAGVRKPPKEETAGRKGAVWSGAAYGDLKVAAGALMGVPRPAGRIVAGGTDDSGGVWSGVCAGLAQARRSEEDWRPREDIGFLLRRAEEGEEKRRCEAGSAVMIMRCRS